MENWNRNSKKEYWQDDTDRSLVFYQDTRLPQAESNVLLTKL